MFINGLILFVNKYTELVQKSDDDDGNLEGHFKLMSLLKQYKMLKNKTLYIFMGTNAFFMHALRKNYKERLYF